MTAPLKRGACPALSDPMPTGDGLIARLTLAEAIRPEVLVGLADAALAHGNGLMEITQRGNLQFRGLTAESAPLLAEAVSGLHIAMPTGLAVDVGPLAGIDPDELADPRPIASAVRKAAVPLAARLGPKVSVVVDGRGKIVLDAVQADIRLEATREQLWRVSVGGGVVGFVSEPRKAALAVLNLIAAGGRETRGRDLDGRALQSHLAPLLVESTVEVPAATARSTIGMHDLGPAGIAIGLGVAFGQVRAEVVRELAGFAGGPLRFAPGRCLLMLGLTDVQAHAVLAAIEGADASEPLSPSLRGEGEGEGLGEARRGGRNTEAKRPSPSPSPYLSPLAGRGVAHVATYSASLVTRADDPRLFVAACAGSEGCASGHIAARRIAGEFAGRATALLDGSLAVHVSGCAKGCAHPSVAALTFVGDAEGAGLVVQGTASDRPAKHLATNEIIAEAERLSTLIHQNRRSDETAAACLARLKPGTRSERAA